MENQESTTLVNKCEFIAIKAKVGEILDWGLPICDYAKLILILTYLRYDGSLKTDNNKSMTKTLIKRTLGLKKTHHYELLNRLIELNILSENNGTLYISNKIATRGNKTIRYDNNTIVIKIDAKKYREWYKDNCETNYRVIGYMVKLFPFLNKTYNIVCKNPNETEIEKIIFFNHKEIGELLGNTRQFRLKETLHSETNIIEFDGKKIYFNREIFESLTMDANAELRNSMSPSYYQLSRCNKELYEWRDKVIERDGCCQCCGATGNLHVHHILNYANHKELRTDVTNGITLCEQCHSPYILGSFHNIYGTKNNNEEQLQEYIKNNQPIRKVLQAIADGVVNAQDICEHFAL